MNSLSDSSSFARNGGGLFFLGKMDTDWRQTDEAGDVS
jgi:hypothetical protein